MYLSSKCTISLDSFDKGTTPNVFQQLSGYDMVTLNAIPITVLILGPYDWYP